MHFVLECQCEEWVWIQTNAQIWAQSRLPWQHPLSDHKMNDQLIKTPLRTSTSPKNLVKVGLLDSETES